MVMSPHDAVCSTPEQTRTNKIILGLDSGNGFIKAFSSNSLSVRVPSLIYEPSSDTESDLIAQDGCGFTYISGDRADLYGRTFLVGSPAYSASPKARIEIAQLDRGKVDYSLHLLLGALGVHEVPQDIAVGLCVSIHDAAIFKDEIKSKLEGTHKIKLGDRLCNIKLNVLACVDEGVGILAHCLKTGEVFKQDKVLMLDLGYGTTISSVFQYGKKLSRSVSDYGVRDLYSAIAKHPLVRAKRNGKEGDVVVIRDAVENNSFQYGKQFPFDFTEAYKACLQQWARENLRDTINKLSSQIDSADSLIACGGGANLPMVSGYLQKKGFKVLANAQNRNAEGLLALAKMKVSKQ